MENYFASVVSIQKGNKFNLMQNSKNEFEDAPKVSAIEVVT